MKAMVLAAGLGSRLRPLTNHVSKPMVRLAGRPCLEHIVRLLRQYDFKDLIVNLHYKPEMIRNYFGPGEKFGLSIRYSYEEELLGTAGGVKKVERYFGGESLLIISGDALTDINLEQFYRYHREKGAPATLALKEVADPTRYGVVTTDDNGLITAFQEKPSREEAISNLANTGIYLFEPAIFNYIPAGSFFDFGRDLFPLLLKKGEKIAGYTMSGYWCDIGNLEVYREAHYDMLNGLVKVKIPGKRFGSNIWLGRQPDIDPSTRIVGPAVIGDRCRIEREARIYGPVVLGEETVIGEGAVIKRGVFWERVQVGKRSRLIDCIVGQDCRVAPGLFLENRVLDHQGLEQRQCPPAGG
ncbi:MAG: NDP-sugar synthase [Firmicutes bacterium]|nr:NDP-sugar synthase [Bacillota bacterium]